MGDRLRVYVYVGDAWACGAYRLQWPAAAVQALEDSGVDVSICQPGDRSVQLDFDRMTGEVKRCKFPEDADVIVMQRVTSHYVSQVPPLLAAQGVATVVDMDDDLSCIHPRNPAHEYYRTHLEHPVAGRIKNVHSWRNAELACSTATLVTCTTPQLAHRYAPHGRRVVLPNCVPAWYLDHPHQDSDVIGWPGSLHSHPDDFRVMGRTMERLVRDGLTFRTVGNPEGVGAALGLPADPESPGDTTLAEWPLEVGKLGIGIAPLEDSPFNRAKSWLKPLELAALGVPVVVSPVDDYRRWAALGGAIIADRPRAWEAALRRLAADANRRAEQSERGRAVAAEYTIEGNAWRWAEAWAQAAETLRTKVPAGAA